MKEPFGVMKMAGAAAILAGIVLHKKEEPPEKLKIVHAKAAGR